MRRTVAIDDKIIDTLRRRGGELSAIDVKRALEESGYSVTYAWVKNRLDALAGQAQIVKMRIGRRDYYASREWAERRADSLVTLDKFIEYETAHATERGRAKAELEEVAPEELGVFEEALEPWLKAVNLWDRVIRPILERE